MMVNNEITEPLEKDEANNTSSFADYSKRSKMGAQGVFPEGLANILSEIARGCLQGLNNSLSILDSSLVKKLTEQAKCVTLAISAIAHKRGTHVAKIEEQKKRDAEDKGKTR